MAFLVLLVVGVMVVYSLAVYYVNRAARNRRRSRLTSREVLSEDEWTARYIAGLTPDVDQWRDCMMAVAKAYQCHYTQLLPSDRFDTELKFDGLHWLGLESDDETEDLEEILLPALLGEDRFDRIMEEHAPFGTLADLCRACAAD